MWNKRNIKGIFSFIEQLIKNEQGFFLTMRPNLT